MKNVAVLDVFLGDNGKGKIVHDFSPDFDFVIRFSGSSNCGHVIYRDGKKYNHHLLPSTDYRVKTTKSFLGFGMVINPNELLEEILTMEQDFPGVGKSIIVDPDTFVVLPEHIEFDKANNKHIGSTNKGVGPAYTDKVARKGVRFYHLINDRAPVIHKLKELGVSFTPVLQMREVFEKSKLLFEGNQGILLDINAGLYPYITSSECGVSGIYSSGFNFVKLDRVYGLFKPYSTKSGGGPFPTEVFDEEAERLRKMGNEYGNTTGRPRRIGHLDLAAIKYASAKGGITHLIITKLDVLNSQKRVKACVSYGKELYSPNDFKDYVLEYIDLPGWDNAKDLNQLKTFLYIVEDTIGLPVEFVSTGINKEDLLKVK